MSLVRKTLKEAMRYAEIVIKANLTPYMAGSPGLGKSAGFAKICKRYNLKMIDIRLAQEDPTTINGFPNVDGGRSRYLPPELFPLEGKDELPLKEQFANMQGHYDDLIANVKANPTAEGSRKQLEEFQRQYCYSGWLVFFDELPSAPRSVQAAAYKIILDKMIGQDNLHPKCRLAAAGNLMDDNAIVNEMGTALRSRMVHIHVQTDPEDYINYATRAGYDTRIVTYLAYQKQKVNNFKQFNTNSSDETFCCERTWEFAHHILQAACPDQGAPVPDDLTDLLCGTVGSTAIEFVQYTHAFKDLPTFQQIINDPKGTSIPDKPAVRYLLMGMLVGSVTMDNLDAVMDYVARFSKDYGLVFVKMLWAKSDKYLDNPKVEALWCQVADLMMA